MISDRTDHAVRGTNDDAQISKASCVQLGYFKDDYLHHFVKRAERRAPIINRGYYARTAALKQLIQDFLVSDAKSLQKQILSLGAGYDTTWWNLQAAGHTSFRYLEMDFHEVVRKKLKFIRSTPQLREPLGQHLPTDTDKLVTSQYSLLAGDLRATDAVLEALEQAGFQADLPTLVIAECVLIYMPPKDSLALVSRLGALLPTAAFLVYEQIKPYDAFGKQMMINLERRGCPLIGIHGSADLKTQRSRFTNHNWQRAWAEDMETIYYKHIDPLQRRRIERLELFDEMEEWHLIQEHYCIAIGINDKLGMLENFGLPKLSEARAFSAVPLPNAD